MARTYISSDGLLDTPQLQLFKELMLKDRECLERYEESMAALESTSVETLCPAILSTDGKFPTRSELRSLQIGIMALLENGCPTINAEPVHRFAGGVYLRELDIPQGNLVLGKIHKHEHFVILAEGACRINTDEGMQDISAPHIWISKPGDQRALYTYEDCKFLTIHENIKDNRDIESLEDSLVEQDISGIKYLGEL